MISTVAAPDKAIVYSSREPDLRGDVPPSLQKVESPQIPYEDASQPFLKIQRDAIALSEAQHSDEGDGSTMVKRHKPFPELRPKHERSQIRKSFNQDYLREHRSAQLKALRAQEQYATEAKAQQFEAEFPKYGRER
ncbi:MAG: hypothetical protein HRT35_26990 [Algicola sp.]|nr:hypothetical protein [Algicola sp.]